jgi:hypothetical protein
MQFSHYAEAPAFVREQIIEKFHGKVSA